MSFLPRKRVVVAVDFSEASIEAVKTACDLAGNPVNVFAIHALLPIAHVSPPAVWHPETDQERKVATEKHLAEYLQRHQLAIAQSIVRLGDPAHEVIEFAKEQKADLIVIPSHGYHGVKRMLFGSLAESLIRHTDCPVLVLHRHDG